MQSGSPEVQNIRRRSRFLNALSVKLRGSHAPLRRTTRSTAVPKNLSFNFVAKHRQNIVDKLTVLD
jgi:hypothetical protein